MGNGRENERGNTQLTYLMFVTKIYMLQINIVYMIMSLWITVRSIFIYCTFVGKSLTFRDPPGDTEVVQVGCFHE